MHFVRMLRQPHLAILWVSQVLSAIGDNLYTIAVLWTAVRVAGGRAGIVAAAGTVATLVFGMLGGVYADRWDRQKTMAAVDVLRAATVAILPVLAWRGMLQLWHLAAVAVVVSGLGALFDPALQASLPALVSDRQMLQATNGLMDMTRRLARAIGPSLAGALVAVLSLSHFFTLDAISFVISALAVLSLGRRFAWQPARTQTARGLRGICAEIAIAVRIVRAHRALAWALASNGISNIAWGAAFTVGAPLLADRVLSGKVGAYGLIVGAYGIGNVIGNIVIGSLTIRRRVAMLFTGRLVLGGGFLIMAAATNLPVAMVGSAVAAIGGPMGDIVMLTIIQHDLPANQIGKVYSLRLTVSSAGMALGLLLAGPLYATLSIPLAIALCALLIMTTGTVGLLRFGLTEPTVSYPPAPSLRGKG
jgi:DHA3 family macrolide efflux protein-like MFS transporter